MDDIVYSEIQPDRFNDVIQHLRYNFFADEPLNKSLSLCQPGEPNEELEEFSLHVLKQGMSFMATLNSTGEVIGVILNGSESKQDNTENCKKSYKDKKVQKIFDFLGKYDSENDINKEFNATKILELKILSVDIRFRGKRIASRLFEYTEKLAKCKGFELMRADATALFSQKLFEKFGFITIHEISYKEFPTKEDPWFKVEPPHESFKIMIKKLV